MKHLLTAIAWLPLATCLGLIPTTWAAQETAEKNETKNETEVVAKAQQSVTHHQVKIAGKTVAYTATAGWLIQKKDDKPVARFGYTAYTRDDAGPAAARPLTFAFNGGPGSSSIWLHLGILGPERVVIADEGYTPPPGRHEANEFSIIDATDLVMVDPVGTGFSKPLGKAKGKDFWGVDQDIKSVAAFIKQYVSENRRWASPKFILGESYGGVRGAGLAQYLQATQGMNLNGLILVSPFLSMVSGADGAAIDLPYALYLPTFAATAWYHDKLAQKPPELKPFLDEVERFTRNEYLPALVDGFTLDAERKKAVAARLAAYTGTSADYWLKADLRVSHQQFLQELLRDERRIAGRIDSRFVGPALNPLAESMDYDPFFPAVGPAFTAAFLDYLHNELDFGHDEEYQVSAFGVEWDWKHQPPGERWWMPYPNLVPDLAQALVMNPGLKLLIQQGYYDLATPFAAMHYDLAHLDVPPEVRQRIAVEYYEAGHMMYLHPPSRQKFRADLARFIQTAAGGGG